MDMGQHANRRRCGFRDLTIVFILVKPQQCLCVDGEALNCMYIPQDDVNDGGRLLNYLREPPSSVPATKATSLIHFIYTDGLSNLHKTGRTPRLFLSLLFLVQNLQCLAHNTPVT